MIMTIFVAYILNDFITTIILEVYVNIWHGYSFWIQKTKNGLPRYQTPHGDSGAYLRHLCIKGLKQRFKNQTITDDYKDRLLYELKTIHTMGYDDYFLIVFDYVQYAKKHGILVGPGRGSAAGSLVAYCLGITNIDPLKYDLLFERFLNPERVSMPDIVHNQIQLRSNHHTP